MIPNLNIEIDETSKQNLIFVKEFKQSTTSKLLKHGYNLSVNEIEA